MTTPETDAAQTSAPAETAQTQARPAPASPRPGGQYQGGPGQGRPPYGGGQGGGRPYQPRGGPRAGGGGRPRGRYAPRRRVCAFCVEHVKTIDYKDVDRLRRYISDRAKMEPPRKTGVCAKHQRVLSRAIKRARHLALLPFVPMQGFGGGYRR